MNLRIGLVPASLILIAANVAAQVTGGGTTNSVPVFTGSTTIGNSPISVSGNNVGIGTTSPSPRMYVAGGSYGAVGGANQGTYALGAQSIAADASIYSYGSICTGNGAGNCTLSGGVVLGVNNTSASNNIPNSGSVLLNSGNVGIGTTSPGSPLTVSTTATSPGNWAVYFANGSTGSTADSAGAFYTPAGGGDSYSVFGLQGLVNWSVGADRADSGKFKISSTGNLPRPGTGDILAITTGGNVGIGTTNPQAKFEINGNLRFTADGSVQNTAWTGVLCGGDYAEDVETTGSKTAYEPGDVLVISANSDKDVQKSQERYSTSVAGIYATKPGVVGKRDALAKVSDDIPMAMVGIVPTKVTAENGPIHRGDLLVTASKPGYAMKGTDRGRMLGAVIGKAMGTLEAGIGTIEVLVTLQ